MNSLKINRPGVSFYKDVWYERTTLTLKSSESIWPTPLSTGVYWNEERAPEGQRDKEINFSLFISSLFDGVGQLLPGDLAGLLMSRPRQLGTPVAKRGRSGFLEVYRVLSSTYFREMGSFSDFVTQYFVPQKSLFTNKFRNCSIFNETSQK